MAKKRPTDLAPAPDLIVQHGPKGAPIAILEPASRRGRAWLRKATTAGDEPQHGAYPVERSDLNPILRQAVADGLTLHDRPTQ